MLKQWIKPIKIGSWCLIGFLMGPLHTLAGDAILGYEFEVCCEVCPAAKRLESYDTQFLKLSRFVVQGKDDWLFRTEAELIHDFGPDDLALKEFGRLVATLQKKGSALALVYVPTRGLVHPDKLLPEDRAAFNFALAADNYEKALNRFRAQGAVVPNLMALLNEGDRAKAFFFRRDHHWTPYGAQRTAEVVAAEIKKMPEFQQLKRVPFTTQRLGMMARRGTLQVAHTLMCNDQFPDQYVDAFESVMEQDASELGQEADLFGETELPGMTLVGTSFSKGALNYNFEGFLKDDLEVDMLNEASAGGSYDGALLQYLPSDAFQNETPKILLWEVPSYHRLSSRLFYREIIPLVNNACRDRPAVFSRTVQLRPGVNEVLFNGGGTVKDLRGGDLQVDLQFSDRSMRKLNAVVWYLNGRREKVRLSHGKKVDTQGRFVFELNAEEAWRDFTFLSLDVTVESDAKPTSVEATLCVRPDRETVWSANEQFAHTHNTL